MPTDAPDPRATLELLTRLEGLQEERSKYPPHSAIRHQVTAEIAGLVPAIIRDLRRLVEVEKALSGLVAKMDAVAIDTNLGDETDRVFAHWEFDEARAALAHREGQ